MPKEPGNDPCLQIQVDLSAMLDGELDPASVRRVMVHSDVCASCQQFLTGIRDQVRLHRELRADEGAPHRRDTAASATPASNAGRLREQLTVNRQRLSKILYELGRCYVLTGLSPDFSREVAKEPVPLPDVAMRGKILLDEVARSETGGHGPEWVCAKELFDAQLRSPDENLSKGQRLLSECLSLEPALHEARIYLGLVHYVRGQRLLSRKQFAAVLQASDPLLRGYALLNLGNLHLDEGDCDGAVQLLLQLVESKILGQQPRMTTTAFFNLGLAYGMQGRFQDCLHWFGRLHEESPHRRTWVAKELGRRSQFQHLIRSNPAARVVAERFPGWFAAPAISPA